MSRGERNFLDSKFSFFLVFLAFLDKGCSYISGVFIKIKKLFIYSIFFYLYLYAYIDIESER